ncbi:protein PPP4R3C-like [Microtus ochrogaster]|uniref:Protein PPP4R3C-like n=1 Tax=Microtus ochrogaster TaxID=79684 RepID=A0ABM0LNW6_MICOH|nr:protein PPP4R3C-like [Microtus ochrogaster]
MDDRFHNVKVYIMKENEQWEHICSGQISTKYIGRLESVCLLVHSELDGSQLIESKINPDVTYKKYQKNLIIWTDANNKTMALCFSEPDSCQDIWNDICQALAKDPSNPIPQEFTEENDSFQELSQIENLFQMPNCEVGKLDNIADLFNIVEESPCLKERLALLLESEDYIKKLLEMFHTCEEQQNMESLQVLHVIIKGILSLNNSRLFNIMFSEEYVMDVIGCLEYDPSLEQPYQHRKFLTESAKFKEVMPITHSKLKQKIHQTYRMQYIHDILLPISTKFQENWLSELRTFIFSNKIEIISMLHEDEMFLREAFSELKDNTVSDERRSELLFFFKEFFEFAKILNFQKKDVLLKTVIKLGIMSALKVSVCIQNNQIKVAALDIFTYLVEFNPRIVRVYAVEEAEDSKNEDDLLLNIMIKQIICDPDPESSHVLSLTAVLRALLDPQNMFVTAHRYERREFMNYFYAHCIDNLAAPILSITGQNDSGNNIINIYSDNDQNPQLLGVVLELLRFCLQNHTTYIKNYILSNNLLSRILVLMSSKHTFLVLCALRFMRQMIDFKDEIYNLYIVRKNLFEPVINAFLRNGKRYNMLNSAIIELFEFIRVEDIKSLIANIVKNFFTAFDSVEYVQTFKGLKIKFEEQKEREIQVRKNLHYIIYEKLYFRHMKATEVKVKEEMCPRVNPEAVVPLEVDFLSSYDTFMQIKETSEDEVAQSEEKSFEFDCSSQSEASDREMSSPSHDSMRIPLVDYSDNEDNDDSDNNQDDKEEEEPPPKRPNLGS